MVTKCEKCESSVSKKARHGGKYNTIQFVGSMPRPSTPQEEERRTELGTVVPLAL